MSIFSVDCFNLLPNDLICEILLKLDDTKDFYRCRCVSKSWLNIIQAPLLTKAQVKKTPQFINHMINNRCIVIPGGDLISLYTMDFHSPENLTFGRVMELDYPMRNIEKQVKLVGICNGLICIENTNLYLYEQYYYYPSGKTFFTLWNPSIGVYRIVPDKSCIDFWSRHNTNPSESYCYFGYDHVKDDYHVVRVMLPYSNPLTRQDCWEQVHEYGFVLDVYSLKNDSWTNFINHELQKEWNVYVRSGVFNSGTLYLIAKKKENHTVPFYHKILAFDFATETFRLVDLPRQYEVCCITLESILDELEGVLCVKKYPWLGERNHLVWLMNNGEHDNVILNKEDLWSKTFEFVTPDSVVLEKFLSYYSDYVYEGAKEISVRQPVIGMICGNNMTWCDPETKLTTEILVENSSSSSKEICLVEKEACVCLRTMVSPF